MTAKNAKKKSIPGDRYYTPKWLVRQCLDHVLPVVCLKPPATILEPSAGTGRFVVALRERYPDSKILAVDLLPPNENPWPEADEVAFANYLELPKPEAPVFDLAVGNPPFTYALPFCQQALGQARAVVYLVRQGFMSGGRKSQRSEFFRAHRPSHVFMVANRPAFDVPPEILEDPEFDWKVGQTDSADYAFICWTGQTRVTYLEWLPDVPLEVRKAG